MLYTNPRNNNGYFGSRSSKDRAFLCTTRVGGKLAGSSPVVGWWEEQARMVQYGV